MKPHPQNPETLEPTTTNPPNPETLKRYKGRECLDAREAVRPEGAVGAEQKGWALGSYLEVHG